MNCFVDQKLTRENFLNGVCRHELPSTGGMISQFFLNGVCRHEQ